jgi:hypothetical protein
VVGRIAAISNRLHNEFHHENIGFFGFFEHLDRGVISLTRRRKWVGLWPRLSGAGLLLHQRRMGCWSGVSIRPRS